MSNSLLITGVAGFIGRYVARYFIERDWSVIGIDNSPPRKCTSCKFESLPPLATS
ncbi:MAG: NAD-dependent epimerase/dehydratase family protein (plasmid) [Leptolyngbya sp. BL-A-14]